jgi:hypothetical protein
MKLTKLLTSVLKKTTPMDATDYNELADKSEVWYDKCLAEMKSKVTQNQELNLQDKIFQHLDAWYVRMALAILYFPIVRFIQDFMNPGDGEADTDVVDNR